MSREVDMNKPDSWSDEDVRYLRDRGLLPADYEANLPEDGEEEEEGYQAMKKKELVALAEERGIELTGDENKKELIAALEEDDASR